MDPQLLAALTASPAVDATDPLVVALTWALTWGAGRWFSRRQFEQARQALPVIAVLCAVGLRAALDAAAGMPLSMDALLRALAAAGVAVLGHSQVRGVQKVRRSRRERVETDGATDPGDD